MDLPKDLIVNLESLLSKINLQKLSLSSQKISTKYREGKQGTAPYLTTEEERLAYLAARLPATYAANCAVLKEVVLRQPDFSPVSLLDIGAGPGTATWAAMQTFMQLKKFTLFEKDLGLISLGKRLMEGNSQLLASSEWQQGDLEKEPHFTPHDLVILSYSLGEIPSQFWPFLLMQIWQNTNKILVIIEPGTPLGYERILKMRAELLKLGAQMIAPCPHNQKCPLLPGDWCHFSARLTRSFHHRQAKNASLGYEDENFSYLIMGKTPQLNPGGRILRSPEKHSGHVRLRLCTPEGIEEKTISRKTKEKYAQARKAVRGDLLN